MCGIVAVYNKKERPVCKDILEPMTACIVHRGPDDEGFYYDRHVALGFRRLSIIDLSTGHQPLPNEDETLWLIFNGEIYNYLSLREELITQGHRFRTNTDSEVLLHLYEQHGRDFVVRLRGMFAFVIYDSVRGEFFGARDYFGIKPMYWTETDTGFLFASEIKSILVHPGVSREVDPFAFLNYLTFQYVPEPRTMFSGIEKLPPATWFHLTATGIETRQYFQIRMDPDETKSFEYYVQEIRDKLQDSVLAHRMSDVPRGAFLSGGVDSTIICALFQKHEAINTFSVGYNESHYSELSVAIKTAAILGTRHHEFVITPQEYLSVLPKLAWHQDEPVADPSAIAIHFLARMAREHVTVVLSGEGADELFGGYNIYREPTALSLFKHIPAFVNPILRGIARILPDGVKGRSFILRGTEPLENRFFGNARIFSTEEKLLVSTLEAGFIRQFGDARAITRPFYEQSKDWDAETRMQYIDIKTWLPGNILMKADKMTMANSLELRVPFLDIEVLKVISRIPTRYKIAHGTTKYILRQAFKDMIPEHVVSKKKLGFPVPIRMWLKDQFHPWAEEKLRNNDMGDWINRDYMLKLLSDHRNGKHDNSRPLWTVLMFLLWVESYL